MRRLSLAVAVGAVLVAAPAAAAGMTAASPWYTNDADAGTCITAPSVASRWICGDTGGLGGMVQYYRSIVTTTNGFPMFIDPSGPLRWDVNDHHLDGLGARSVVYVVEREESWRASECLGGGYACQGDEFNQGSPWSATNPAQSGDCGGVPEENTPGAVVPLYGADEGAHQGTYYGRAEWLPTDGTHQLGWSVLVVRRSAVSSPTVATLYQYYGYAGRNGCFASAVTSWTTDPGVVHVSLPGWGGTRLRSNLTDIDGVGLNPQGTEEVTNLYDVRAAWSDEAAVVDKVEAWALQASAGTPVAPVQGSQDDMGSDPSDEEASKLSSLDSFLSDVQAYGRSWWETIADFFGLFTSVGGLVS